MENVVPPVLVPPRRVARSPSPLAGADDHDHGHDHGARAADHDPASCAPCLIASGRAADHTAYYIEPRSGRLLN
jgi:hypothetical protein